MESTWGVLDWVLSSSVDIMSQPRWMVTKGRSVNLRERTAWASQLRAFGADAVSNTIFFFLIFVFPRRLKLELHVYSTYYSTVYNVISIEYCMCMY